MKSERLSRVLLAGLCLLAFVSCGSEPHRPDPGALELRGEVETDAVCGMGVDPAKARSAEWSGEMYYFCSERCVKWFKSQPTVYAARARKSARPAELK